MNMVCALQDSKHSSLQGEVFISLPKSTIPSYLMADVLSCGQELDWEVYLKETASLIVKEQSPRRLLEVS
jgi:hypothetical protein